MDYRHFKIDDFKCPCCGVNNIDLFLVEMLDVARSRAGIPFTINSGCRCAKHNKDVKGSFDSSHLVGKAVDIDTQGILDRYLIVKSLLDIGFIRIEIGSTWTHADIDYTKPRGIFLK
jgi:zinc D-Ala-D-Ala carboxypeptidase